MATFARIVDGKAIDVVVPDPASVSWASNDAEWLAKLYPDTHESFVEVPTGTKDSALDNEDGSYTKPPEATAPEPQPVTYTDLEFLRYAKAQLGSGARVTEIIEGFRDHASAELRYAHTEYTKAKDFTREAVDEFLAGGVAGGIVTTPERSNIYDSWEME